MASSDRAFRECDDMTSYCEQHGDAPGADAWACVAQPDCTTTADLCGCIAMSACGGLCGESCGQQCSVMAGPVITFQCP